jgi:hypothetical protein
MVTLIVVAVLLGLFFTLFNYTFRKIELPSGPAVVSFRVNDFQELAT